MFCQKLGSELDIEFREIVLDEKIVEAVNRASEDSTSELESFHSCLNRNAPKMEGLSHQGMLSRYVKTSCFRFALELDRVA